MASKSDIQFSKNTTDNLKKMGFSTRGDLNPEKAPTIETYDMHDLFGEGDKVRVCGSVLMRHKTENGDMPIVVVDGTVIGVTRRLVIVRYDKTGWNESFCFLDFLGNRVTPIHS